MTSEEIATLLKDIETYGNDEAEFYTEATPNKAEIKAIIHQQMKHV